MESDKKIFDFDENALKRIRHNIETWDFKYLGHYKLPEVEANTVLKLINEKIAEKEMWYKVAEYSDNDVIAIEEALKMIDETIGGKEDE